MHHHDAVQSCIESYSCATQTAAWEDMQGLEKLVYCGFYAVCLITNARLQACLAYLVQLLYLHVSRATQEGSLHLWQCPAPLHIQLWLQVYLNHSMHSMLLLLGIGGCSSC